VQRFPHDAGVGTRFGWMVHRQTADVIPELARAHTCRVVSDRDAKAAGCSKQGSTHFWRVETMLPNTRLRISHKKEKIGIKDSDRVNRDFG
jgi:hypothetical protein